MLDGEIPVQGKARFAKVIVHEPEVGADQGSTRELQASEVHNPLAYF